MSKASRWAMLGGAAAMLLVAGCGSGKPSTAGSAASGSASSSATSSTSTASVPKQKPKPDLKVDARKSIAYATVPSSAPTQSGTVEIAYRNIAIDPDAVRVKVGATIKWTNYDPVPHNVVSEGGPMRFASGDFGEGHSYKLKVTKVGVIHYECTLEPTTMNGTIEVVS